MSPGTRWPYRVDATRWDTVRDDLDAYGCALTGPLLTLGEAAGIAALYPDGSRFRSTIDMGRYRFGEGEYRYFTEPFPEAVTALKEALSAAPVRHGVSVIRSGQRFTLGLVFHDAA